MRNAKSALALLALLGIFLTVGGAAQAEEVAKDALVPERVLGNADAPITVEEFVSLTCSHCASFNNDILPELKAKYVETGKVKFILRDFPLDGIALRAAALARCMPKEQFYPFITVLFKNQAQWAFGGNPTQAMIQYAKLGGLGEEKAKACADDAKLMDAIAANIDVYRQKYAIQATPSFVINDGKETLRGAVAVGDFTAVFDKLLAEAKK